MNINDLPYGLNDLDPNVDVQPGPPERVRCYVRGCTEYIQRPRKGFVGEPCPVHGIRCHYSSSSPAYSYVDATRNIIVDAELFGRRVIGNPFKYESNRLGFEKSEDTLSWNVFRSLMLVKSLGQMVSDVFGIPDEGEPDLYLWGIKISGDDFRPWDLLIKARSRFEENLPVKRPKTEPDIALHLSGKYLILIEAKFTSKNPYYVRGPRQRRDSLTMQELLDIYHDPSLGILDTDKANEQNRIPYQLWRNTVFAEWMAQLDSETTKAYHLNLVREGYDVESATEFKELLNSGSEDRFAQVTWEDIYRWASNDPQCHSHLCTYMETKTAGLVKAFAIE
jgi:hypothetical protein